MQHSVVEYLGLERIDQRLQSHAAGAHPLSQGRSRDGQASASEDRFLAVQRQVIGVLAPTSTWASRLVVGMPLSMTCASTGACVMVWQWAQAHLPRMWRSTLKTPGT
jgi:hypothetical protein